MSSKTAGLILAIAGLLVALFFALADVIGVGDQLQFGPRQIIGTVVGAVVFIVGLVVYLRRGQT